MVDSRTLYWREEDNNFPWLAKWPSQQLLKLSYAAISGFQEVYDAHDCNFDAETGEFVMME